MGMGIPGAEVFGLPAGKAGGTTKKTKWAKVGALDRGAIGSVAVG
jgi:hypothetical protein